ncbi:MAG: hypothetical protein DRJ15_02995 [Bacteroidetes bacterium]|nr:MAG: hypothetical protein DRJ15_02995 [Bacteroidota bacterium]
MKKYFLIALTLIMAIPALNMQAQEMKYLFQGKDKDVSISGFAAIFNEFSGFDGDFAFSMGGGAAMLIDQRFFIGGYGQGITTRHLRTITRYEEGVSDYNIVYPDLYTRFGHGGFWLGYIHNPKKAINFGINTKLGWGAVSMTDKTFKEYHEYDENWYNYMHDNVFVIQPEIDLNMNLLKWMRASVGVGYRFVTGLNQTYEYLPNDNPSEEPVQKEYFKKGALDSFTGNITLAFGWFNN